MRILIAHAFYRLSGGEDRYVTQQVELLRDGGHEVELFAKRNEDLPGGVKTAARMTYSRRQTDEAYDAIKTFQPDVIHVHNIYPALGPAVHLAAKRARVPLVMTVHNFRLRCPNGYMFTQGEICRRCETGNYLNGMIHHCFPERGQKLVYPVSLWTHRTLMRIERIVDMFIAPSEFMENTLLGWGMPRERVAMIRNFTDAGFVEQPFLGTRGVYVGRLSSEKGISLLLRALHAANDPPFSIVGDGPIRDGLEQEARELKLTNCAFVGVKSREEVLELVRDSRFVACPSLVNENAPLAVLEALAAAKPIVVSDSGGLPELAAGGNGICVRRGDLEEFAEAFRTLYLGDALCLQAGGKALRFAREQLAPPIHRLRLEAAFQAVRKSFLV